MWVVYFTAKNQCYLLSTKEGELLTFKYAADTFKYNKNLQNEFQKQGITNSSVFKFAMCHNMRAAKVENPDELESCLLQPFELKEIKAPSGHVWGLVASSFGQYLVGRKWQNCPVVNL